jgi:hypothetical protein
MSNEIKTRPLTPTEQKYTYAQSMQLEGQTGTIGHLRGDFATTGYGFYTTWFDTRPQWKSDEFKADLDTVINALREDKGLLHNRCDMSAFTRHFPESAIKGNYCTEYGFRVDTEKQVTQPYISHFPINLWRWYDEQRRKEMCPISESKY